jgi:hypothetical protein
LSAPPSAVAPAPGALPPSAIGTPAPQVAPIAPLSPPTTSTFLGGGGTTVTTPDGTTTTTSTPGSLSTTTPGGGATATFPGGGGGGSRTTGASPSEAAPSTPGGGAPGFASCMSFWDAGTHMTKREWAAACRRTENRLQTLRSALDEANRGTQPGDATGKPAVGKSGQRQRTPAARARMSGAAAR